MKPRSNNLWAVTAFALSAVALASHADAQDIGQYVAEQGQYIAEAEYQSDWGFSLGAGVGYVPEYQGSDKYEAVAFPTFEITWRDTIAFSGEGLSATIYERDSFSFSATLGYGGGREESDSDYLKGLGDIEDGTILALSAELDLGASVAATADVQKFMGGSKGTVVSLGVQSAIPLGAGHGLRASPSQVGMMLIGGLSVDWADDDYNQSFFGVSSTQSAASGLRQYTAESGLNSVNAEVGFIKPLGGNWGLTGMVQYSQLLGDAADSPIVKSKNNYSAVLAVGYSF